MSYNLENRTKYFSFAIVKLLKGVRPTFLNRNIISQLLRSATSVGANYQEAIGACSRKDFKNKIFICKKEIQETKYWLELLKEASNDVMKGIEEIRKEAHELNLIFNKITYTLNKE